MSKLYFRVYLHFVAIIVVFGAVVAIGWLVHDHDDGHRDRFDADGGHRDRFEAMARLIARSLPEDDAALPAALGQLADDFRVRLALYRARPGTDRIGGDVGAAAARARTGSRRMATGGRRSRAAVPVAGRPVAVGARPSPPPWPPGSDCSRRSRSSSPFGAWPLARRITRRLERLQTRVDALGAGDLGARVEVEGSDEIAALAESFNYAAERIESLVAVQRTMLASASHELRSPLTRMRMAIELFADAPRPELRERIERDVVELDTLIDELLLASRLQTVQDLEAPGPVDLLALTAEEGARVDATVVGSPVEDPIGDSAGDPIGIEGDHRLLRQSPAQPLRERPAGTAPARRSAHPWPGTRPACSCGSATGGRASPRSERGAHLRSLLPSRRDARGGHGGRARPAPREGDRRTARVRASDTARMRRTARASRSVFRRKSGRPESGRLRPIMRLLSETAPVGSDSIGPVEGSQMQNVRLTGPMEAYVRGQIESGAYTDMSDVVRAGIRPADGTGRRASVLRLEGRPGARHA